MSELEILELFAARNEEAIKRCEKGYGAYCRTIAYRILQDEGEAAECVNDTWFQAWQAIPPAHPAMERAAAPPDGAAVSVTVSPSAWEVSSGGLLPAGPSSGASCPNQAHPHI